MEENERKIRLKIAKTRFITGMLFIILIYVATWCFKSFSKLKENNTAEAPKVYLNQSTQNTNNEIIIDINNIDGNLQVNNTL